MRRLGLFLLLFCVVPVVQAQELSGLLVGSDETA